jgi:hypothetical protein
VAVSILYAPSTYFRTPREAGRSASDPKSQLANIRPTETSMLDIILIAAGLGFFALSVAYAYGCDRL